MQTLRQLEEAVPADSTLSGLPVIGEEYDALRRNLAKVRAMAVQNEILFNTAPEVFQSDVSSEGLKALADLGTERLYRLVLITRMAIIVGFNPETYTELFQDVLKDYQRQDVEHRIGAFDLPAEPDEGHPRHTILTAAYGHDGTRRNGPNLPDRPASG